MGLRGPAGLRQSVGTLGSLSEAFRLLGRYDEALGVLQRAQEVPGIPPEAQRLLHAMRSQVRTAPDVRACEDRMPLAGA